MKQRHQLTFYICFIFSFFLVLALPAIASDWVEDGTTPARNTNPPQKQTAPKSPWPDMPVPVVPKVNDAGKNADVELIPRKRIRSQSPDSEDTSALPDGRQKNLLKGIVQHSNRVEPLDSKYLPGKHFDINATDNDQTVDDWVQIPSWFAGPTHVEQSLITSVIDFRTGFQTIQPKLETSISNSSSGVNGGEKARKTGGLVRSGDQHCAAAAVF